MFFDGSTRTLHLYPFLTSLALLHLLCPLFLLEFYLGKQELLDVIILLEGLLVAGGLLPKPKRMPSLIQEISALFVNGIILRSNTDFSNKALPQILRRNTQN